MWNEGNIALEVIMCEKLFVNGKPYRKYCNRCMDMSGSFTKNIGTKRCPKCGKVLNGWFNHPAVKEYWNFPAKLIIILHRVRGEMLYRGFKPNLGLISRYKPLSIGHINPWQTKQEQIEVLKQKGCLCKIEEMERG